jgi:hypothetical protein
MFDCQRFSGLDFLSFWRLASIMKPTPWPSIFTFPSKTRVLRAVPLLAMIRIRLAADLTKAIVFVKL